MNSIQSCGFSEKFFEFGINLELFNYFNNIFLSNTVQEKTWGYDSMVYVVSKPHAFLNPKSKVKLLLFQYKRPVLINLKVAKTSLASHKKIITLPWSNREVMRYGIYYESSSKVFKSYTFTQHDTLKHLANQKGVKAFYCSPKFISTTTLVSHINTGTLMDASSFIDVHLLKKLGTDIETHHIYYDTITNLHKLCSEDNISTQEDTSFENVKQSLDKMPFVPISELNIVSNFPWTDEKDYEKNLLKYLQETIMDNLLHTNMMIIVE